jgi:hypothetical protein
VWPVIGLTLGSPAFCLTRLLLGPVYVYWRSKNQQSSPPGGCAANRFAGNFISALNAKLGSELIAASGESFRFPLKRKFSAVGELHTRT